MREPSKYAVPLDDLIASARVPLDEQGETQDDSERPEHVEGAGYLPGDIRPWAL